MILCFHCKKRKSGLSIRPTETVGLLRQQIGGGGVEPIYVHLLTFTAHSSGLEKGEQRRSGHMEWEENAEPEHWRVGGGVAGA